MARAHGRFVWYELMTTDVAGAQDFYTRVVGWTAVDSGMPGMDYTIFKAGEAGVAGMMAQPEAVRATGAPPGWLGYVYVDDIDAMTERLAAAGGTVHRPPTDIPEVGRFAVVADPHGAVFCLFRDTGEMQGTRPEPGSPGTIGWHELMAGDLGTAFDFYAGLFGWQKVRAVDMGEMGIYQTFGLDGEAFGGMMTKPPQASACFWLYYVQVPEIDAAIERVKAAGGSVLFGPVEVPGGSMVAQCHDPQGAIFALLAPPAAA